ncbi:MAG: hypothetical protein JOZ78_26985 [Chroococcidiopsidaceae cyanobacterium CP_BM_ER_R8_30]|nr:hypothetical protein [Chroococcidiopsidaceae cyanobacterium CP_BM_ER_R8_30]
MNSNSLTQLLQEGFRVTIGAAVSLVETLQDPQKRDQNLSQLKAELEQLTQEWAVKGEITEQEARNFVDTLLNRAGNQSYHPPSPSSTNVAVPQNQPASPQVQMEIQELTAQLATMRKELENLRNTDSNPS